MTLTEAELRREAATAGFRFEVLEKAIRLLEFLDTLRRHPYLKSRIALKGGTALNLFVFDMPRLSVDIDLNYIGAAGRRTMLNERPKVEQAIEAVAGRLGIQVRRVPSDHAGGKWRMSYTSATGQSGTLELDLNFMLRVPLWPPVVTTSRSLGSLAVAEFPVLDVHELAAGKLAAFFGRSASRDMFDVRELLRRGGLDRARLRTGFVVYGALNRRDWREVSLDEVGADPEDVDRFLLPVLRGDMSPAPEATAGWTARLVAECRELLRIVLPLEPAEREFLDRLNDGGEIHPEMVTVDPQTQAVLREHPALQWKAQNVRKHYGLPQE